MALILVIWTGLLLNIIGICITSAFPEFTKVADGNKDLKLAAVLLVQENIELLNLLEKGLPKSSIPLHLQTLTHHVTALLQFIKNEKREALLRDLIHIQKTITRTLQAYDNSKLLEKRLRLLMRDLSTLSFKIVQVRNIFENCSSKAKLLMKTAVGVLPIDYRLANLVDGLWIILRRHQRSLDDERAMAKRTDIYVCEFPNGTVIIIIINRCRERFENDGFFETNYLEEYFDDIYEI